jgi:hypothetical protein
VTNITVYNRPVFINAPSRVSYNGGYGGIRARPMPEELRAGSSPRFAPTPMQRQHVDQAAGNPRFTAARMTPSWRPPTVHRVTGDGTPISRDMALSHGGISAGRPGNAPNGQPTRGQSPRNQFPQGQFQQGQSPQGQQRGPQGYTQQGRPVLSLERREWIGRTPACRFDSNANRPDARLCAPWLGRPAGQQPAIDAIADTGQRILAKTFNSGDTERHWLAATIRQHATRAAPEQGYTQPAQRRSQTYQQPAQHHAADGDATRTRPQTPARATPAPQQRQDHPRPDNR